MFYHVTSLPVPRICVLDSVACVIDLQAWGKNDANCDGHIIANGVTFLDTYLAQCTGSSSYTGFLVMTLNYETCSTGALLYEDTYYFWSDSSALATYLEGLPAGIVVVGVTADSAQRDLSPVRAVMCLSFSLSRMHGNVRQCALCLLHVCTCIVNIHE